MTPPTMITYTLHIVYRGHLPLTSATSRKGLYIIQS
jgi:hypothetical protein